MRITRALDRIVIALALLSGSLHASSLSEDIQELHNAEPWRVSAVTPGAGPDSTPDRVCLINNLAGYEIQRFDFELPATASDATATTQIATLDRKVVTFLLNHGWSVISVPGKATGIPNLHCCYAKQGANIQIFKTTGRCTMNSPCKAYDGFAAVLYQPRSKQ